MIPSTQPSADSPGLVFTRDRPKVDGWYWVRRRWTVVYIRYVNADSGLVYHGEETVGDVYSMRDCEWMGQVYRFLGLTTGVIVPNLPDHERRDAYAADITYATNNELGFDYLRDNMKYDRAQMVQRPVNFTIVD